MCFIILILSWVSNLASGGPYALSPDPIDVVIPCTEKDRDILPLCISGIKTYGASIRRVIVVSDYSLTTEAEWFNEAGFPFTKEQVAFHLVQGNREAAHRLLEDSGKVGWYYQQLLKYYAPFVIPGISSNVLVLDADTIFLNRVAFLDAQGGALYTSGKEYYSSYFDHANRLIPGLRRRFPLHSGIVHHMVFQRPILEDLFATVETHHHRPLWQAFCDCVSPDALLGPGASEYEIYFNFAFGQTDQVHLRRLKGKNIQQLSEIPSLQQQGYHYVSYHSWIRGPLVGASPSRQEIFSQIYERKFWGENVDGTGSSGGGSQFATTAKYRQFLQNFLATRAIRSVVDLGCGDWEFSRHLDWRAIDYLGIDLVPSVIARNQDKYGSSHIQFRVGDGVDMELPEADLLICKDVLQHLSNEDVARILSQLGKFKYCLLTTDVDAKTLMSTNPPILSGGYRPIDLTNPPFSLIGKKVLAFSSGPNLKQVLLIMNAAQQ